MHTCFEFIGATNCVIVRDDKEDRRIPFLNHASVKERYPEVHIMFSQRSQTLFLVGGGGWVVVFVCIFILNHSFSVQINIFDYSRENSKCLAFHLNNTFSL